MEEKLVAIFKLVSGEEILAEYEIDEQFYILKAPRRVIVTPKMDITMMPWIVGNPNGTFPVGSDHILTVSAEMDDRLKAGYLQQTSPLDLSQTAPPSLIV